MKLPLFFYLLLIPSLFATAQKEIPAFGKIDKTELEMTDCDFDKGAVACKLIDWGSMYYERGTEGYREFKQQYERRVRIKILKDKGLSYANITIPYYSYNNDQKIVRTEARTYNLDENGKIKITEVSKNSIYSKRIDKRSSQLIIAFPEAKVGSVIEYKFRVERENFWIIDDWNFQSGIPTAYSEFQLKVPAFYQFIVHPVIEQVPEMKEKVFDETFNLQEGLLTTQMIKKNYIMRMVPGLKDEPYMGSFKDYQQRLEFQFTGYDFGNGNSKQFSNSWKEIINDLNEDEDFGEQLNVELPDLKGVIEAAKNISGEEARIKFILNYLQKNMQWDDEEDIYSYDGIKKAWELKKGSTGDINLLLTALMKRAGLSANPILFSTRDHGLVNNLYPFVTQFNVVMCHVAVENRFYIINAADKYSNYKLIPENVANTSGLIILGEKGTWIDAIDNHKYKITTAIQGEIDATGTMKGSCVVISNDYAKKDRSELWRKDKDKFKATYFTAPGNTISINDLFVNNAENDSLSLEQKVNFTQKLNSSGNYSYFTINLFTGLEKDLFVEDTRTADIDFGYQQEYTIFGNFTIADGYTYDELPKDITMVMPGNDIEFVRSLHKEDNLLNARISIKFKKNFYQANQYPAFKEFYKKIFASLDEQIVLKKKATS